ncbi:MAG TPA: MFS transporter [Frankiaceae bacterium]|nr:MFS transporter [Frankiaceae bacterium]
MVVLVTAVVELAPDGTLLRTPRRAWFVWALAVLAYAVAVFDRGSLGVSAVDAQHRFGASAAELSLFVVLQLAVYASLQVPVGILLDRFGTRIMVAAGALVMATGQALLGTTTNISLAVLARALVGAGDAMTFISVLRLIPTWFAPKRAPVVTQLTGILGQLGQVAAAYPLVAVLDGFGWEPAFVGAAAVSLVIAAAVLAAVRDSPPGTTPERTTISLPAVRRVLGETWREPGTRIGLWTHFVAQFSGNVFGLLWGYPFLVVGQGLSPTTAGLLIGLLVLVGMGVGPTLGALAAAWPLRRSVLVFTVVGASATAWAVVLLWPGRAPLWLLVLLVVVLASNGPGSLLGFDYARTENPQARLGSASGIVNVGGFIASLILIFAIGTILDLLTPGGSTDYTLSAFKAAFAFQYVLWAIGLIGVLRHRRTLRRRLSEDGIALDAFPRAVARRLSARS